MTGAGRRRERERSEGVRVAPQERSAPPRHREVNGTAVAIVAMVLVVLLVVVMYLVRHRSGHDLHLTGAVVVPAAPPVNAHWRRQGRNRGVAPLRETARELSI